MTSCFQEKLYIVFQFEFYQSWIWPVWTRIKFT